MKQVSYRGGIIKFEIPDHWVEEYGENGGGTFYEDAPDSATLRLNLLTFESESKTTRSDLARVEDGVSPTELAPKVFLYKREEREAEESGENLIVFSWKVVFSGGEFRVRIALFTYTILANQKWDDRFRKELQMVDNLVSSAEYLTFREPGYGCDIPALH